MTELEESQCRTCVLIVTASRLKTTYGRSRRGAATATRRSKKHNAIGGVQASTIAGAPNRVLVLQDSTDHRNAKVFRTHAAPQGICDNLINALKLLANQPNQQKDGDSSVGIIVPGLLENSRRKIMDGLLIAVDNYAVNLSSTRGLDITPTSSVRALRLVSWSMRMKLWRSLSGNYR